MSNNSERSKHVDTIIRNHVIWSMGAGLIPVLIADVFAVSALQLDMIRQMCKVYDVDFSETQGKAIVTSLTSSTLARVTAGSLVKMLPVVGSIIGGVTVSVFAGASTYALGQVFKRHFESGGTILDFDPARLKKLYKEQFEKGKKVAEQLRKDKKARKEAEEAEKTAQEAAFAKVKAEAEKAKASAGKGKEGDVIQRLKELAELRDNGVISEEEFQEMKKKLISEF
ncbi:MAG: DUF697 domain-containing protein [Phaeodactylibacter sp.]|nr:DUF697 domain-containing protein [Phaeodactylibacter sp.]MCB9263740.1 DUF697 domain-containing protein [Lewinellaceae bacterium]MCB9286852.1 DUF697 domain-containing protein [Lewinellaceae bacterium]